MHLDTIAIEMNREPLIFNCVHRKRTLAEKMDTVVYTCSLEIGGVVELKLIAQCDMKYIKLGVNQGVFNETNL